VFVPFVNVLAIAAAATMPVPPDPATLATIFHQLFDLGMPAKEIAQRHGLTDRAVRRYRQCWQLLERLERREEASRLGDNVLVQMSRSRR
jgi:hypothetical protein